MSEVDEAGSKRRAGWLPDQEALEAWLDGHDQRVLARGERASEHPVIEEFRRLIATDPLVRMYVVRMVEQVPTERSYDRRHLRDVEHLLAMINEVLTMAPEFNETSMVGTPLNAILDWPMGTPAGFAAFRDPRINAIVRRILEAWCAFLSSEDSLYVLNDSPAGWMCEAARRQVGIEQYEHDADDEHWGFSSWNDFFTRRFREGERPVADPGDDAAIANACESTPYGITTDVKRWDRFWIKSQPYSLHDMLDGDESVDGFVGGTVYQAFLSALNYHRWHSPVSGTILRTQIVPGTYFSEADTEGADARQVTDSQAYMAHVATRAIIVIEADNPTIGVMAFVAIGMSEVSSCVFAPSIEPGAHVEKGQELGHFRFGGSSHCLVFRPGVIGEFTLPAIPQPHDPHSPLMRVRSRLAVVASG